MISAFVDERQDIACEGDALVLVRHQRVEPDRVAHLDLVPDVLHKDVGDTPVTVEGPDRTRLVPGRFHQGPGRPAHGGMADERADSNNKLVPQRRL